MGGNTKAYVALVFICIVWGTTYMAIRVGVAHYPAFLFAGVRQLISGVILAGAALAFNRKVDFSARNISRQMLIGFLMLTLGNGCVTYGERTVPSGIAALICSIMPLFAVLFNLLSAKGERFNSLIGAGMLLGTLGVSLIFRNSFGDISHSSNIGGMSLVMLATCSWALGSVFNKKNVNPVNSFLNAGMQLFFGGLFMLMLSPFIDDLGHVEIWNREGLLSLLYLIVFGSVLSYAAYMYSLSKLPVGIATIYAYINPLVAVIMGYFILKEEVDLYTGMAFVAIIVSVFLVNQGYRRQHKVEQVLKSKNAVDGFPEAVPVES